MDQQNAKLMDPTSEKTLRTFIAGAAADAVQFAEITDANLAQQAADFVAGPLAERFDRIDEMTKPIKDKTWAAHQGVLALIRTLREPVEEIDTAIRERLKGWRERERKEAAQKAAKAAREAQKAAEDLRLARAEALEEQGNTAEAERVISTPVVSPAVTAVKSLQKKLEGMNFRTDWKYRITDEAALIRAAADENSPVPLSLIKLDTKMLGQQARSLKTDLNWPGVEVYSEDVPVKARRG